MNAMKFLQLRQWYPDVRWNYHRFVGQEEKQRRHKFVLLSSLIFVDEFVLTPIKALVWCTTAAVLLLPLDLRFAAPVVRRQTNEHVCYEPKLSLR